MNRLRGLLEEIGIGLRLVTALPRFLRAPPTAAGARQVVQQRLRSRASDFLSIVRAQIFTNPHSPYLPLLQRAGCELGDLERQIERDGIEVTLRALFREGVYVTMDEFKGNKPIVRGNLTYTASAKAFRNRSAAQHLAVASGGSTGPVRGHMLDLASVRDVSVDYGVVMEASGIDIDTYAIWDTAGPSVTSSQLWCLAYFGRAPARAFCMAGGGNDMQRLRLSGTILATLARGFGRRIPRSESAPLRDPSPILMWLEAELRRGTRPTVRTFPTAAMRLSQAAIEQGVDLTNARVVVAGEPLTAARIHAIRQSGLGVLSLYGASESGLIGYSCQAPTAVDDVHLQETLHAMIRLEADDAKDALVEGALLMTSLRPRARLILFNASLGDSAALEQRACGCPLQELGSTTHLHTIHSFEKFTSAGMTFRSADIIRVLEEVLPQRFGGTPADYQLAEGESEAGAPVVRLRIHPALAGVDAEEAKRVFLDAIGSASDINKLMATVWSHAAVLQIVREHPVRTPGGKLLHFQRNTAARTSQSDNP